MAQVKQETINKLRYLGIKAVKEFSDTFEEMGETREEIIVGAMTALGRDIAIELSKRGEK